MTKTQTYTKINTLYKRYQNLGKVTLPNPVWKVFQNKIIMGDYSDEHMAYIKDLMYDCFSKIDGTNTKIVYYPSTGECFCSGKTDNANIIGTGQKAFIDAIIERIKPTLAQLFPASSAKFVPKMNDKNLPVMYEFDVAEGYRPNEPIDKSTHEGVYVVEYEEAPVYIYGEFYGKKIQAGGNYDKDNNRFAVFDICVQGWYVPKDMMMDYCVKLELPWAPYIGQMTIDQAEAMVRKGFKTRVPCPSNPDYLEEGIVARPIVPIKDPRGKRIIVKIKHCDYAELDAAIHQVGIDEYYKFNEWYNANREEIEKGSK